jgi:cytochrome c-type biogenesis protein CcmH/NrfG
VVAPAPPSPYDVIQPLGADGSVPFEERGRRWSDRTVVIAIAVAALALAGGVAGYVAWNGHTASASGTTTSSSAAGATPSTTQDGRDLSQISNDEMETVIAANPDVVPMRLALVERYLRAADSETTADAKRAQLERAQFHAGEASARATTTADQARALRYLGWTTALLTDPTRGAGLIEQSLAKEPGNPDALWFLASVKFEKLNDAAGAKPLLEQLLATPIEDPQRQSVQSLLDKVNAALPSSG